MSRARVELEPVYLLSQRPYRETSQLIEVFSPNYGRVGLIARGMRGAKPRQRGTLALFQPLLLSWLERGDLGTVTAAEAAGNGVVLLGERVFHGWYLNELLLKLLQRHDPHPELYADYAQALVGLAGTAEAAEAALRIFEKRLLQQLGYGLPLADEFDPQQTYRYWPDLGFVPAQAGTPGTVSGASLLALHSEQLQCRAELDDARRLLRQALEPHVPRAELRTPQLLKQMRSWRKA